MSAFSYPLQPQVRRHGPQGYANAESFRPWLRDEFSFRCVYCLLRERWGHTKGVFNIDHFLPAACYPDEALTYHNLLYCCATCNAAKGERRLPSPERVLFSAYVQVEEDGRITAKTSEARRLIRVLGLDAPEFKEFRFTWLSIISLAKKFDAKLYRKLMGFPEKLPNLASLRPPRGNTRPDGVLHSYFAQRKQGSLPETY